MTRTNMTQDFIARMERKYELKVALNNAMFGKDHFNSRKSMRRANHLAHSLKRQQYHLDLEEE